MLKVYLAGEIHSNWREEIIETCEKENLDISKIYKGLPKKFIFPKLRTFYFKIAVWFYAIKDKLNI